MSLDIDEAVDLAISRAVLMGTNITIGFSWLFFW